MKTNAKTGLTGSEAEELYSKGLYNKKVGSQSKTVGQIIYGNIFTYFNFVFAVFAGLLILVRSYVNMTFLPIIICNTVIGIIQELRAKSVLDKLNIINASKIRTLRDSVICNLDSEELVLGDICIFDAGSQIVADAEVVSGTVRVNEALITGEADEVTKLAGDTLLSGSFVVSGECKAVLTQVGHNSYASKIMLEAKASRKKVQTEMMRSLDELVRLIGIAIIPIGIILFVQCRFILHNSLKDSVVSVVAALVGMIPEGLYLLASVALVVSVIRLAKRNVIVHEMACVESLARVNVMCVDKTGTITENVMAVEEVKELPAFAASHNKNINGLVAQIVNALDSDNITMATLKSYFDEFMEDEEPLKVEKIHSFSSETKYSAVVTENGSYLIGAPEQLLLSEYAQYEEQIEEYAKTGARVLVVGWCDTDTGGIALTKPVVSYAFIIISNPVRKEAKQTFEYFQSQGVSIKVISGDNPVTVSGISQKAGIEGASEYIDASALTTDEQLKDAVSKYNVFGRVSPKQKQKIIAYLKEAGNVVAMTGDGTNDVLALKEADCSVAMASGSDAAANASQIVLLDSNFDCMPSVVLEGRRVVNNIQRSASLFLVKNIFSMLLALFSVIGISRYPFYPTQISLLGAFTIGIPAFLLAMQPNKNIISGHFLTNVVINALPAGVTDFIIVAVASVICRFLGINHEESSTIMILIVLLVGMLELIKVCLPFNRMRVTVCILMGAGIVLAVLFAGPLFAISGLSLVQWLIVIVFMAISAVLFMVMCRLVRFMVALLASKSERFKGLLSKSFK